MGKDSMGLGALMKQPAGGKNSGRISMFLAILILAD